jgi:hypothetical protein
MPKITINADGTRDDGTITLERANRERRANDRKIKAERNAMEDAAVGAVKSAFRSPLSRRQKNLRG